MYTQEKKKYGERQNYKAKKSICENIITCYVCNIYGYVSHRQSFDNKVKDFQLK